MKSMHKNHSILSLLLRLWNTISARRQKQFLLLLILMIFVSFAEIISIGAVLPFLAVLTSPDRVFDYEILQPIIVFFRIKSPDQLLLPLTLFFCFTVLFAAAMRLFFLWVSTYLAFQTGHDLSSNIYLRTLFQPYSVHISRNSSKLIHGISIKASGVINGVIVPLMTIVSSLLMIIIILIGMFSINPFIAISCFGSFGLIYGLIIFFTKKRLLLNGERIAKESNFVIKSIQEGLGAIRDVLIDGNQLEYCKIYRNADMPLRRAEGKNLFIGQSPRYVIEAFGIILIASLAYSLTDKPDSFIKAIPLIGALAVAAQRLLPLLQQTYVAWSCIRGGQATLSEVIELLEQKLPSYDYFKDAKQLIFKKKISIMNVSFKYKENKDWVLQNINLNISQGSCIGIIGATGSGKSTLIDIVMGLMNPTKGKITVDNIEIDDINQRGWLKNIAHVPQEIFLIDSSIEENIAFGIDSNKIDYERVIQAARNAHISDDIERILPDQYKTMVGERGVRLSGGQKQRIAIARALYKNANVLVLDEATSALDVETEKAVMNSIRKLNKKMTILIITHRKSTLKYCDKIIEISKGSIKREDP